MSWLAAGRRLLPFGRQSAAGQFASAYADLHARAVIFPEVPAADFPATECLPTRADWLRTYPPGDDGALYLHDTTGACGRSSLSILTVTVVRAGTH